MAKKKENRDISVITGVFVTNEIDEVLWVKMPKWDNKWGIPGGHVERGETLEQCALRELKEETGLSAQRVIFKSVTEIIDPEDFHKQKHFVGFQYVVQVQGRPELTFNDELTEARWMTFEEAYEQDDLNSFSKKTLKQIFENKQICASCDELKTGWQRALADYQNLQREVEVKRSGWIQESKMHAVESFLPIYENMKKALGHLPEGDNANWEAWAKGCQHVVKQFNDVFSVLGIEVIKTVGEQFNPAVHEAMAQQESDRPEGEILEEVDAGFKMGERVLKPAKVVVSK